METTKTNKTPADSIPAWQRDLDEIGLVRRALMARKWHGADWWFALISSILLLGFILMAVFPALLAPFGPKEEVGPAFLGPGQAPATYEFIVRGDSGITSLLDIPTTSHFIGLEAGSEASTKLRNAIQDLVAELEAAGSENVRVRPRPSRFATIADALDALEAGEIHAVLGEPQELEELLPNYEGFISLGLLEGGDVRTFPLGTNTLGQDMFSRLIWGSRTALFVAFVAAIFAVIIGVPIGLVAGYVGGAGERVLTLVMDSLYSFPGLILAIAISAVLGPSLLNVIVAIAVLYVPTYYRVVRGQTLAIKEQLYVEAARSLGAKPSSIVTRYIFPNIFPSIVVIFSVNVADAILTSAGLAFLGLGLPPDTPDWGIDIARGHTYLREAWWMITFPGLMVALVTLAFSMLGESLSEILNPRLSEK